jgi:hypothetical protein
MHRSKPRTSRKKPLSIIAVLVATGEATPLTPKLKARLIRGTCDLLEDHADELDAFEPLSGDAREPS